MGNWRMVNIIGTVSKREVEALRNACTVKDYEDLHCLSIVNSLMGLGNWVGTVVNARGNLAERNYSVEDVAMQLEELVEISPTLNLKVHCGGDYEDSRCVATISVVDGDICIDDPEIEFIAGLSNSELGERLLHLLNEYDCNIE